MRFLQKSLYLLLPLFLAGCGPVQPKTDEKILLDANLIDPLKTKEVFEIHSSDIEKAWICKSTLGNDEIKIGFLKSQIYGGKGFLIRKINSGHGILTKVSTSGLDDFLYWGVYFKDDSHETIGYSYALRISGDYAMFYDDANADDKGRARPSSFFKCR